MHVLAEICTKNRYHDTLPLAIMSVVNQTRKVDKLVILDDSEPRQDMRQNPLYQHIFNTLKDKGIEWHWVWGNAGPRGQHHLHEQAQEMATDLIWRIDDDEVAEPNVLETLIKHFDDQKVGAVAGLVITPPTQKGKPQHWNKINELNQPNCQWIGGWGEVREVEHLYSSFVYRKGIAHYELGLSPVAHREETLFSHSIYRANYKLLVDPSVTTWHFRSSTGGIRSHIGQQNYDHDEKIFQMRQREWAGYKLVVLRNGIGDHIIFKKSVLPELKKKYKEVSIAAAYPFVFEGEMQIDINKVDEIVDSSIYDIYAWCCQTNWQDSLEDAFKKMYGTDSNTKDK